METLKIKKLDPDAKVPERATSGSAGLDSVSYTHLDVYKRQASHFGRQNSVK